mgnify:CR=1 FL=1
MKKSFKGVGTAKAISLAAAFELGLRTRDEDAALDPQVKCSTDIYNIMRVKLERLEYIDQDNETLFKETLQPFNCLMHFGIGAEYMGARITAGYNLGVFDIMRVDSDRSDLMTDGFFVSVGYVFDFD